ncbi:MAG: class II fumarate hydratase [Pirellulales bacterium]|nr:class II fumarate hydratase [Pirellulales bacterium]
MPEFRTETDSMGPVRIPAEAYYGPQTQRAVDNFPLSGRRLAPGLIHALGRVKGAAATANRDLGRLAAAAAPLDARRIDALLAACREVAEGRLDAHFPVDVYQTGSGTSSNMNANEVIARRAMELAGDDPATRSIHPNDHVNLGQSTNDVFPTAIHVAVALALRDELIPALTDCAGTLQSKADAWQDVLKIGRTHLADATPMTLGQEIGGLARQVDLAADRARRAQAAVLELPLGGTAVGTGINTHPEFGARASQILADETGMAFVEAVNHFEANAQRDGLVECHGQLRAVAVSLFAVANNIRWLASGPRAGFFEMKLPDLQPGSSIMPGKVNPVLCESLMQVCARVLGNDQTVAFCGASGGQFQLNVMMPVMADATLESIALLTRAARVFTERCLAGMEANRPRCEAAVEASLAMATALAPVLGYERAAALAKEALAAGLTIRELCRQRKILPDDQLAQVLDPRRMIGPR